MSWVTFSRFSLILILTSTSLSSFYRILLPILIWTSRTLGYGLNALLNSVQIYSNCEIKRPNSKPASTLCSSFSVFGSFRISSGALRVLERSVRREEIYDCKLACSYIGNLN